MHGEVYEPGPESEPESFDQAQESGPGGSAEQRREQSVSKDPKAAGSAEEE
jgi:hypothetical protein